MLLIFFYSAKNLIYEEIEKFMIDRIKDLSINDFIEEMKAAYKLRPQDKIDKILNTLDVINAIMEMK